MEVSEVSNAHLTSITKEVLTIQTLKGLEETSTKTDLSIKEEPTPSITPSMRPIVGIIVIALYQWFRVVAFGRKRKCGEVN